jgi:hypothetical protein
MFSLTDGPNIPSGYRQGFITATTVLLTASLLYFRYAALESGSGDWTPWGVVSVVILSISICIQLYTLWRALQPDDEKILVYKITLRWFAAAVFLLVVSFVANVVASLAYGETDETSPGGAALSMGNHTASRDHETFPNLGAFLPNMSTAAGRETDDQRKRKSMPTAKVAADVPGHRR